MWGTDIGRLCGERSWSRSRLEQELHRAAAAQGQELFLADGSLKRMFRAWIRGERGLSDVWTPLFSTVFGVPFEEGIDPAFEQTLGSATDVPDGLGLAYETDIIEAVSSTAMLLDVDLERVTSLRLAPAGWSGAAVDWLARDRADELVARGGARVGHADVAALKTMTELVNLFETLGGRGLM